MSSTIPPFQPRPAYQTPPITANKRKSYRCIKIFPHFHRSLPTSNAPCARFRLRRKDHSLNAAHSRQMKALHEDLKIVSSALQDTIAANQHLFAQLAQIHHIKVSYGLEPSEDIDQRPQSPIHVTFPARPSPPTKDILLHRQYVPSVHDDPLYLEIISRPSSSLSMCSASSTASSSQLSCPSSPILKLECLAPITLLPPETADYYCVYVKDVIKNTWAAAEALHRLRRSTRKRRPGLGLTRARRHNRPHRSRRRKH